MEAIAANQYKMELIPPWLVRNIFQRAIHVLILSYTKVNRHIRAKY
jgi:hypothetical protein